MRTLLLALPFIVVAACGSPPSGNGDALVQHPVDLGGGGAQDMAGAGDGGLLPLASKCTMNSQCASGVCAPYKMGAYMLCTFKCTAGMAAPQCTAPGVGQCNGVGYCKFPGM